jgi:hypothetical protein
MLARYRYWALALGLTVFSFLCATQAGGPTAVGLWFAMASLMSGCGALMAVINAVIEGALHDRS